jgi:hypothetical protein
MPKVLEMYSWCSFWRFWTASWRRARWALLRLVGSLVGQLKPSRLPLPSTQTMGLVGKCRVRSACRSIGDDPRIEADHLALTIHKGRLDVLVAVSLHHR